MIESVHDLLYGRLAHRFEVGALGKILTDQAIRVLIESSLPGMIRMSKIHLGLEGLTDALMGGKLFAIVGGNGTGVCLIGPQPIHRLAGDFVGLFRGHFADHGITRPAFHQGVSC